jgi:hypothetical protein
MMPSLGRILITIGLLITAGGLVVLFLNRLNIPIGRFPGDFSYSGKHVTIYFPLVTCIVISIVVSIVFWILNRR